MTAFWSEQLPRLTQGLLIFLLLISVFPPPNKSLFQDKVNHKKNPMNVATAMATLGMANTRGLEDPAVGPMLLSHAYVANIESVFF